MVSGGLTRTELRWYRRTSNPSVFVNIGGTGTHLLILPSTQSTTVKVLHHPIQHTNKDEAIQEELWHNEPSSDPKYNYPPER
jgi:hypothetical protein